MAALSFRVPIFALCGLLGTLVIGAPIESALGQVLEDVVFETVVVTSTTVICSTRTSQLSDLSAPQYQSTTQSPLYSSGSESLSLGSPSGVVSDDLLSASSNINGATSLEIVTSTSFSPDVLSSYAPYPLDPSTAPLSSSDIYGPVPELSGIILTPTDPSVPSSSSNLERPSPTVTPTTPAESEVASFENSQLLQSTATTSMGQHKTKTSSSKNKPTSMEPWKKFRGTLSSFGVTTTAGSASQEDNVFVPIQPDNILPQIPIGRHHPVPRTGIEDDENRTLQTNKFYANAFLGNQDQPIWTHPYSLWWGKGHTEDGQFQTWGMNIGHIEERDVVLPPENPPRFYLNPPHRQSMILSALELGPQTTLSTDTHLPFSVNINLNQNSTVWEPTITFPAVQGMSFITGGYRNATPMIQCPGKGFRAITGPFFVGKSTKYQLTDQDGREWVAYINPIPSIKYDGTAFKAVNSNTFIGPPDFKGTIQIAKNPLGAEGEALYDKATGAFVSEAHLSATVNDTRATYSLSYTKVGSPPLLMFILPHHMQSLDPELKSKITNLQLRTTTKGTATAIWADTLTFVETNLPTTMGFGPWSPQLGIPKLRFSAPVLEVINAAAERDLRVAMEEKTPEDSMYYAGKTLAKFAQILWILKEILGNPAWATGLVKLEAELARYVQNRQKYPLFYDDSWKGLVSNAGFNDPGADFGNTYYNDHHFHYGYFVYAAAVVGNLNPAWLETGDNKAWVNSLVKDFAESDYNGRDYPFSRAFDWWHGHSWAKGLFESADGKDEESTSEDGLASLAVKMWGKVSGDANMERRGNLMLAIQARSFNNYFYLQPGNTNHPARFIPNTVTGILFENKVDHTTYFGDAPSLIHGIHILPISPATPYLRAKPFVAHEWNTFFSNDRWRVEGGWRGLLMANLAVIDASASWEFFKNGVNGVWEDSWIDGGASRSWYLVFAAGLGGARKVS